MTGFQRTVYTDPAYAVEGDFASANPRASMLALATYGVDVAIAAALVAAAVGVTIGRFARARNSDNTVTNADPGVASRIGFVHRDQPAIITPFLAGDTMLVPSGQPITLFDAGDFWARFAGGATIGQKVYANFADGSVSAAATGAPPQGASVTATTATNNVLNVTAVTSGALAVGDPVTGAGIPAGAYIQSFGTGTGGTGTYILSQATTASAAGVAVTAAGAKETAWYVHTPAAAGELAMISTRPVQ